MKVRIDVLKAPWPTGAKVGDVVELDAITSAFAGKCTEVGDDVDVTIEFNIDPAPARLASELPSAEKRAEELQVLLDKTNAELEASSAKVLEMQANIEALNIELSETKSAMGADLEASSKTIAELTEKLSGAAATTTKKAGR